MQIIMAGLSILFFIVFGIFPLVIGFMGIEYHLGIGWAIAALVCSLIFRFTLPLTIGIYFGVVDVLGWHWFFGLLIAVPGFILMIPGYLLMVLNMFIAFIEPITSKFSRNKNSVETNNEITVTLETLKHLQPKYDSENVFQHSCVKDAFQQAEHAIRQNENDVITNKVKNNNDSLKTALMELLLISGNQLSMGSNHVYRGTLSNRGKGFLYVYYKTMYLLLDKGFIDEREAENGIKNIQEKIKIAG